MLARLSLTLFGTTLLAGVWFWWTQPSFPLTGTIDPVRIQAAEQRFQNGVATKEDALASQRFFGEAADRYRALSEESPSADLYFNLGNANLLANRLPEAILAFRQGLLLAPDDNGLRRHLAYARSMVGQSLRSGGDPYRSDYPHWLPTPPTLFRWAALAALALSLTLLVIAFTRQSLRAFVTGVVIALAFAVCAWLAHRPGDERPIVVVARDGAALRTGNGESYPSHPILPVLSRGVEGRWTSWRGGWAFVELDSGEAGWMRGPDLLIAPVETPFEARGKGKSDS